MNDFNIKRFSFLLLFLSAIVMFSAYSFYEYSHNHIKLAELVIRNIAAIGVFVVSIFFYAKYSAREQKEYYRSIIDNSNNVIIVTNGKTLIDANKTFFRRFRFENIEEFVKNDHKCLTEYFVQEDGYLNAKVDGKFWFLYAFEHNNQRHIAKLQINDDIYYFKISVFNVKSSDKLLCILMTDVTHEENYKIELEKNALTDQLTSVANRRFFDIKLKEEVSMARRYNSMFSLLLLDIDHFKKINDTYGHDVGDSVLSWFSNLIQRQIRESDILCRIGGEEFAIILPESRLDNAIRVSKKLNKTVREDQSCIVGITISIGVVEYIKGESEADIYKRVDNALYKAKSGGRDRVAIG